MSRLEAEFSGPVTRALDGYAPAPAGEGDWEDVLRRVGPTRPVHRRRRWFALAATAAALLALSLATPLGGAIRDTVAGFSDWLRGTPGSPVSAEEQRAFDEANARGYAAFPGSPQLRRLIRTDIAGVSYDLLGFRSGDKLCIRLAAGGAARGSTTMCAPIDDLRNDDTPVRVLVADWPVGQGEKTAVIGFDRLRSARAQVTAGIAADGVRAIELVDDAGEHTVDVAANAFLFVATEPEVGQRVSEVRARLADGRTVPVPFTISPWGPGHGFPGAPGEPGGPTRVERVVDDPRIGWFERREERGEPLASLADSPHFPWHPSFGRLLAPDPQSEKRVALMLGRHKLRPSRGEPVACAGIVRRGGIGASCGPPENLFPRGPFSGGYELVGAGDQYATFSGIAADDVTRLELFTATGDRIRVPLKDNAYLAEVAIARFPVKLVAYDARGRVIGIERMPPYDETQQIPVGDPIVELGASAAGSTVRLRGYRTKEGGSCWYVRETGAESVNTSNCVGKEWNRGPVRLGLSGNPPALVYGRVRDDVERIVLRYADGDEQRIEPGREGYVLVVIPREHRARASRLVELAGVDAEGKVMGRQRLPAGP